MAEALQRKLQAEIEKFKESQKDLQKTLASKQQLDGQLNENTAVKDELDRVEEDAAVYKLLGPVLVKQSRAEALETVNKRISYITAEVKRQEQTVSDLEKKQTGYKENLQKLQTQFQQAQLKAAARA